MSWRMLTNESQGAKAGNVVKLQSDDIHLWFAFLEECAEPALVDEYLLLLSTDERERYDRFHFDVDRRHFLLTRALVRTVLSRYVATRPRDWRFHANRYGRPHIANVDSNSQHLSFNLSHTDGLVLLGVTAERQLGVDVESMTRSIPPEPADFLAAREVEALRSRDRPSLFWDIWTLKESYIKARGLGLSIAMNQFSFSLDSDRIEFEEQFTSPRAGPNWHFWQLYPSSSHVAAICMQTNGGSHNLEIRKIVPLRSAHPFSLQPKRWTAR
jgi:4'-phosphopantetheinyl transferase